MAHFVNNCDIESFCCIKSLSFILGYRDELLKGKRNGVDSFLPNLILF